MRLLIAGGILLGASLSSAAACPQSIAGPTINWAGVVCEARNETDDFFSPAVQECLNAFVKKMDIPSAPKEICALNKKFKRELCKGSIEYGVEPSMRACMRSRNTIPREVSHGIGG